MSRKLGINNDFGRLLEDTFNFLGIGSGVVLDP